MAGSAVRCAVLLLSVAILMVAAKKELKLLHVLSANKFYVPDYNYSSTEFQVPSNLTYNYFIKNAMDMPNSIKMHMFNLGVHLRSMYGEFLGSVYLDEIIQMQTTEFPVSIIAAELINAGLWPPVEPQIWKDDLPWQPIPFVYKEAKEDTLLLGSLCPNFEYETHKVLKTHYNLTSEQTKLINFINTEGHVKVNDPIQLSLLYLVFQNNIELKKFHPNWVKKIFPSEELLNVTLTAYELLSKTTIQRRLNGGPLLKQIIKDSKDKIKGTLPKNRKINIYSGDERNLAAVLTNLNISMYDLPDPGSALIFELFEENGDYFIKTNYYTGSTNETIPYELAGCELFCPIEKFTDLVRDYLPDHDLSLCGSIVNDTPSWSKTPEPGSGDGASVTGLFLSNVSLTILSIAMVYLGSKI